MHRQDSTYHILCYTSRGALAETRNSSMGPLSYNGWLYLKADFTGLSRGWWKLRLWASVISLATVLRSTMKDRSDDPPHHEWTIDLQCGWVFLPEGWLHRAEQGVVETAAVGLGDLTGHRPPWRIDPTTHRTMSEPFTYSVVGCSYLKADFTGLSRGWWKLRLWASVISLATVLRSTMKDRSDDPPHHERTIDLQCGWVFLPEGWLHRAEQGMVETAAVGLGDLTGHHDGSTPWRIDPTTHRTMSEPLTYSVVGCSYLKADFTGLSRGWWKLWLWASVISLATVLRSTMKDRSDDPPHHEWTIDLQCGWVFLPEGWLHRAEQGVVETAAVGLGDLTGHRPPWRIDPRTHRTMSEPLTYNVVGCSYLKADFTGLSRGWWKLRLWASVISLATVLRLTMKDRSDDPPHHERTIDLMCGWLFLPEGWLHRAEQGVVETAAVGLGDLAGHRAEVDKTHISISRHGRHLFISGKKRSTSSSDRGN